MESIIVGSDDTPFIYRLPMIRLPCTFQRIFCSLGKCAQQTSKSWRNRGWRRTGNTCLTENVSNLQNCFLSPLVTFYTYSPSNAHDETHYPAHCWRLGLSFCPNFRPAVGTFDLCRVRSKVFNREQNLRNRNHLFSDEINLTHPWSLCSSPHWNPAFVKMSIQSPALLGY